MNEIDFATPAAQVPATVPESTTIFQVIERAARDPNVDIDKLERLLQLQERMQERQATGDFDNAMADAQEQMRQVRADANNPQTRSKYASYSQLDAALRPVYSRHGFAISFDTEPAAENYVRVVGRVSHRGGHRQRYQIDMPADGKGAKGNDVMTKTHATGSAVTYGKRYLLCMIFNVAIGNGTDDDGNAAGGRRDVDGPGSSWGPGGKQAAIDDARRDGLMDNAPKVTAAKRKQFETWTNNAVQTLKLTGQTAESLQHFWEDSSVKLDTLAEYAPDLHKQFTDTFSAAYETAKARVPNT